MATLRDIRHRISSIKSTQKITKAMKMVAAAKLRKAQESVVAVRPYANKMGELLQNLFFSTEKIANPFFVEREIKNIAMVIVTSDRGLCGAFNSNIAKAAVNYIKNKYFDANQAGRLHLIIIGKKGYDFFLKRNYKIDSKHTNIFSNLSFRHAQEIMNELKVGFLSGKYDTVEIIFNEFKSIIQQKVNIEQILPFPAALLQKQKTENISPITAVNYIYEPSCKEIIDLILPKYLDFQIWKALLESNAAEQSARMTAMDSATLNADEIIRELNLVYNKARQASITKELLEVVSGAEALQKVG